VDSIHFNDGSTYHGTLKNGVPYGLGTCIWKDGNQYDGEWKNGLMHGFGTFLWTSGQRYDGEWKDGKRDGMGVKIYADGSSFTGFWKDCRKHGVGVFVPPAPEKKNFLGLKKDGDAAADGERTGPLQTVMDALEAFPRSQTLTQAGTSQLNRAPNTLAADSVLTGPTMAPQKKTLFIRKFDEGRLLREDKLTREEMKLIFGDSWEHRSKPQLRKRVKKALGMGKKLQQKKGQLLYKGMIGYDLMIRLQLGIRYSIGRLNQQPIGSKTDAPLSTPIKLQPPDFTAKTKVFFPSSGSHKTPAHPSSDFKWKDYSPMVFRNLRLMWGIGDAEYMLSLGGSSALWQLNSPGKSGCMFFLSDDEKFIIKTMRKSESKVLVEMLQSYYTHMEANPDSLVPRYYGVHGVKQVHGRTVRFVVMNNIFCTDLRIHRKFDLKGSTEGRTAGKADPNDPKSVFKDLDLDVKISLNKPQHARVLSQIQRDAAFLRDIGVMDYSLLLGIHYCSRRKAEEQFDLRGSYDGSTSMNSTATAGQRPRLSQRSMEAEYEGPEERTTSPGAHPSPHTKMEGAPSLRADETDGVDGGTLYDRARNFEMFSNKEEVNRQMTSVEARMRELGFTEERIADTLGLVRLKILGDKKFKTASKGGGRPGAVVKALQQYRQDLDLKEEVADAGSEDGGVDGDTPRDTAGGSFRAHMGYNTMAVAMPRKPLGAAAAAAKAPEERAPEEVVLCFGIIDILQDYNTRKVFERGFKSVLHDSYAISVAPPKLYSKRFVDFMTKEVFMEGDYTPSPQHYPSMRPMPSNNLRHKAIPEEES